jgi:hypothetical protein
LPLSGGQMTVEVKKAVDEGIGMPKLGVSVWVEGRQVARFELLDDADLFVVSKRKELAAQADIEREIHDKGRDSDCA